MKQQDILRKAQKYLKAKHYDKVINFLEPQIFKYRSNSDFFHILGLAYLKSGDVSGAASFLNRALQIAPENEDVLLALAAVHLRREELDKAVKHWLSILELNYRNKYAQRALETVRKQPLGGDFFQMSNITKFLPDPRAKLSILRPMIFIGAAVMLIIAVLAITTFLLQTREPEAIREGSKLLLIENQEILGPETVGKPIVEFDEASIRALFLDIQKDFEAGRDYLVQYNINRILYSNASAALKSKAQALEAYLKKATFITLNDSFSYTEVAKSPKLYNKVFVRWKGRVANLTLSSDETTLIFDFLVGYHESQVLEGIVRTELTFPVIMENNDAVEVIGAIAYESDNARPLVLHVTDLRLIITEEK